MNDALLQIGVGGIFAVLVIRSVLDFLGKGGRADHLHTRIASQVDDLHKWHAPDAHGRQDWKGNHELTIQLAQLARDLRELINELRRNRSA